MEKKKLEFRGGWMGCISSSMHLPFLLHLIFYRIESI